jgi:hypothetical protein
LQNLIIMENNKAWAILREDERSALTLTHNFDKSTWQAGEIMNKAHYKYLEIKARAEKFLKMFTAYYEQFDQLVPPATFLHRDFVEYLNLVIIQRQTTKKASDNNPHTLLFVDKSRDRLINTEIEKLKTSKDEAHKELYLLIMEFDRWNNHRILPKNIQEPSAFKRRNKSRNLKHLKKISNIPTFTIKRIISKYQYEGKFNKLYIPLLTDISDDNYIIIPIKRTKANITDLSKVGLFMFEDKENADDFAYLIEGYINKKSKTCKDGQKFWPKYRLLSEKAINWRNVNNIVPIRKYLHNAFVDLELVKLKKNEHKLEDEIKGEKRTKDQNLWK